jgi:CheY-like chemotaxis protein
MGTRLNKVILGIGITKEYLSKLKGQDGEQTTINDCIHNCILIEEAALQLEQELAGQKKLDYRLMNPDQDFQEVTAVIENANKNISLLVVDDDEGLCDIVKKSYVRKGFQVDVASSKDEALKQLENAAPNIILLDLYLNGERAGVDILRAARVKDPNIKVIVITYEDQEEKLREINELHPEEVLTKPVRGFQLEAKINGIITSLKG